MDRAAPCLRLLSLPPPSQSLFTASLPVLEEPTVKTHTGKSLSRPPQTPLRPRPSTPPCPIPNLGSVQTFSSAAGAPPTSVLLSTAGETQPAMQTDVLTSLWSLASVGVSVIHTPHCPQAALSLFFQALLQIFPTLFEYPTLLWLSSSRSICLLLYLESETRGQDFTYPPRSRAPAAPYPLASFPLVLKKRQPSSWVQVEAPPWVPGSLRVTGDLSRPFPASSVIFTSPSAWLAL